MTRLTVPFRLTAWVFMAVLVLLTIAPPSVRPDSGVPHHLEHFASFFIAGALWYMGYPRRLLLCLTLALLFAGGLELLQVLVPGRHARLIDFAVDALGAWAGSAAAFAFVSVLAQGVLRIKKAQQW
jgi:VanZ family protein